MRVNSEGKLLMPIVYKCTVQSSMFVALVGNPCPRIYMESKYKSIYIYIYNPLIFLIELYSPNWVYYGEKANN